MRIAQKKAQGVKIDGMVSKVVIRIWLEEGADIGSWNRINNGTVDKIMLEAAIKELPPVLKLCFDYRWIKRWKPTAVENRTGLPKSTYYRRCNRAIDFIYYHVNGEAAGLKDLLEAIKNSKA